MLKAVSYSKLVSLNERDRTLINYQESNRMLERDVNAGTLLRLTHPGWLPEKTDRFDDKENSIRNWSRINRQQQTPDEEMGTGIIKHFMKQ
jgi:hypothetical protein